MNLVTKNVSNDQLLYESRLKQVLEAVLRGDLLRLADVVDDLRDVVHELTLKLSSAVLVVERCG